MTDQHHQLPPRTRVEEYEEPRPNNGIYRFRCRTTTTPSTAAGIHRVIDEQVIEETVRWPNNEQRRRKERCATIQQSLDAVTLSFTLRVAAEECALGQEPRTHYDDVFSFDYDVNDALRHISGWEDEHAQAEVLPAVPQPLVLLPPAQITTTRGSAANLRPRLAPPPPSPLRPPVHEPRPALSGSLRTTTPAATGDSSGARFVDLGSYRVGEAAGAQQRRQSARRQRITPIYVDDDDGNEDDSLFMPK
ncbi:hypothetical protein BAUCODRAFT_332388 [Baudoinia panamericana UAMH 10762]|uniref:Uncharacterized protein n=1 Tax=Baudoinia panamericana (strain UAMH 10762) TaxID=717646 RepID=M2MI68_BAUPA|nr:uncharacterized protein BAUCODRAFT_332388 [Baudoinia panamericana UAMH 10762]EMC90963.1 hypothetical protein BAUCODRAFT_332388 [Baudoinia panamericana UAMH 10762]